MKTQRRKITKPLSVHLTDEEVLKYGREAARAVADRESIENDFDSIKKDYKARIDEQSAIVAKLSPRIHSSQETRDVECEEIKNWTKGTVVVTRLDTFEVVESRPMREDEKQMEVKFDKDFEDGDGGLTQAELASPGGTVLRFIEKIEKKRRDEADVQPAGDGDVVVPVAVEPLDVEVEVEDGGDESNPFA